MRGSIGIVIGLVGGAGGMYLALRPPWGGRANAPPIDAGVVAMAPADAGSGSAKPRVRKKKRRPILDSSGVQTGTEEYYEETEPEVVLVQLSDADRRLEWRGDDVTLPAQRIDMGAGTEARSLDDSEINATIAGQSGAVQECVVQSATDTDLRATVTVKLVVDGNGRVIRTKLEAPRYMLEHGLLACAKRAAARMKFPATGAPTLVTLPVNLG